MRRRKNVIATLRKQRDRLGRFVVGLFAAASFTIAGVPCLAMANSPVAVEQAPPADSHSHAHHEHGHGGTSAHGHEGATQAPGHGEHPSPQPCPHCPVPGAMPSHTPSSEHSFCSAFEELADRTSFNLSPSLAKVALVPVTFEIPPPLIFHPPPMRSTRALASQRSAIALNVRNCVFLI